MYGPWIVPYNVITNEKWKTYCISDTLGVLYSVPLDDEPPLVESNSFGCIYILYVSKYPERRYFRAINYIRWILLLTPVNSILELTFGVSLPTSAFVGHIFGLLLYCVWAIFGHSLNVWGILRAGCQWALFFTLHQLFSDPQERLTDDIACKSMLLGDSNCYVLTGHFKCYCCL